VRGQAARGKKTIIIRQQVIRTFELDQVWAKEAVVALPGFRAVFTGSE
jgi:hypothetical protein